MMRRLDDGLFEVTPARREQTLDRDGHRVWYSDAGAADEIPLVLIHGGPGGHSSPLYRRLLDGSAWRIVQFDQRGCGQSRPQQGVSITDHNTLADTISDMEVIREALGIERWVIAGGSWGSSVALAYAQAHPQRCLALLLVSTWLLRRTDVAWWFYGVRTVFPELWEAFSREVSAHERDDLIGAYYRMIFGDDKALAERAACALYTYEEGFMHADPPFIPTDPVAAASYARVFIHYAANRFFLEENQLLDRCDRIAHLPALLVSGRYDMCTPVCNAWALAACLPKARLRIVPGGGHYPTEPAMAQACARASADLRSAL